MAEIPLNFRAVVTAAASATPYGFAANFIAQVLAGMLLDKILQALVREFQKNKPDMAALAKALDEALAKYEKAKAELDKLTKAHKDFQKEVSNAAGDVQKLWQAVEKFDQLLPGSVEHAKDLSEAMHQLAENYRLAKERAEGLAEIQRVLAERRMSEFLAAAQPEIKEIQSVLSHYQRMSDQISKFKATKEMPQRSIVHAEQGREAWAKDYLQNNERLKRLMQRASEVATILNQRDITPERLKQALHYAASLEETLRILAEMDKTLNKGQYSQLGKDILTVAENLRKVREATTPNMPDPLISWFDKSVQTSSASPVCPEGVGLAEECVQLQTDLQDKFQQITRATTDTLAAQKNELSGVTQNLAGYDSVVRTSAADEAALSRAVQTLTNQYPPLISAYSSVGQAIDQVNQKRGDLLAKIADKNTGIPELADIWEKTLGSMSGTLDTWIAKVLKSINVNLVGGVNLKGLADKLSDGLGQSSQGQGGSSAKASATPGAGGLDLNALVDKVLGALGIDDIRGKLTTWLNDLTGLDLGGVLDKLLGNMKLGDMLGKFSDWLNDLTGLDLRGLLDDLSGWLRDLTGLDLNGLLDKLMDGLDLGDLGDIMGNLLDLDFGNVLDSVGDFFGGLFNTGGAATVSADLAAIATEITSSQLATVSADLAAIATEIAAGEAVSVAADFAAINAEIMAGSMANWVPIVGWGIQAAQLTYGFFDAVFNPGSITPEEAQAMIAGTFQHARSLTTIVDGPMDASTLDLIADTLADLEMLGSRAGYTSEQIAQMREELLNLSRGIVDTAGLLVVGSLQYQDTIDLYQQLGITLPDTVQSIEDFADACTGGSGSLYEWERGISEADRTISTFGASTEDVINALQNLGQSADYVRDEFSTFQINGDGASAPGQQPGGGGNGDGGAVIQINAPINIEGSGQDAELLADAVQSRIAELSRRGLDTSTTRHVEVSF